MYIFMARTINDQTELSKVPLKLSERLLSDSSATFSRVTMGKKISFNLEPLRAGKREMAFFAAAGGA